MVFKWAKKWYVNKVQKPLAVSLTEWSIWRQETKKNHPFKYFVFETLPSFYRRKRSKIGSFKYHVTQKYLFGYHYLKLDVKRFSKPYGIERLSKYSWMDADEQIQAFMFQILVNYVEKELGYDELVSRLTDENDDETTSSAEKEAFDLYEWYINDYCDDSYERIGYKQLHEKYPNHKYYDPFDSSNSSRTQEERDYFTELRQLRREIDKREQQLDKEMTENLIRLIKLRHSLWT